MNSVAEIVANPAFGDCIKTLEELLGDQRDYDIKLGLRIGSNEEKMEKELMSALHFDMIVEMIQEEVERTLTKLGIDKKFTKAVAHSVTGIKMY